MSSSETQNGASEWSHWIIHNIRTSPLNKKKCVSLVLFIGRRRHIESQNTACDCTMTTTTMMRIWLQLQWQLQRRLVFVRRFHLPLPTTCISTRPSLTSLSMVPARAKWRPQKYTMVSINVVARIVGVLSNTAGRNAHTAAKERPA